MESCDCSSSLCISTDKNPIKKLLSYISKLIFDYREIRKYKQDLAGLFYQVKSGMTDNQIEILRIHELDARLSIGCAFLILHYYITYIERCKAAQFALDDNPDVGKFQYYLKLRSRHKKSIRELLSLEDKDVITIKERTYYFMDQA